MLSARLRISLLVLLFYGALSTPVIPHPYSAGPNQASLTAAAQRVADIHGGAGPWAVAGYRMGLRALQELDLLSPTPHTSMNRFAVEVIHESPLEIQFTSIVDGLHAGTGASLGKMNLRLVEVGSVDEMRSLVIHRESGKQVEFRVTPTFLATYRDLAREELAAAGQRVLELPDEEIFEVTVTP